MTIPRIMDATRGPRSSTSGRLGIEARRHSRIAPDSLWSESQQKLIMLRDGANGPLLDHGDSGGPLFVFGANDSIGVPLFPPGRHIIGVASGGDVYPEDPIPSGPYSMYYAPTFGDNGVWIDKRLQDFDGDLVADYKDNCPTTYNPTQANCNLLAEKARNTAVLGDACDPVPCSALEVRTTAVGPENCVPIFRTGWEECSYPAKKDQVTVTTRPSHPINMVREASEFDIYRNVDVSGTDVRACHENLTTSPITKCDRNDVLADTQLDWFGSASAEIQDPLHAWHRITYDLPNAVTTRGNPRPAWTYGSTKETGQWSYASDVAFWLADPNNKKIAPLTANPTCDESDLDHPCPSGMLWFHARTDVGITNPMAGTLQVGTHDLYLANSHVRITPNQRVPHYCRLVNFFQDPAPLLQPGAPLERPIAWHPWIANAKPRDRGIDIRALPDTELLVQVPSGDSLLGTALGALQDGGGVVLAPHNLAGLARCGGVGVTPGIGKLDAIWLSAAESDLRIAPDSRYWQAASISGDGTNVLGYADADVDRLRASQPLVLQAQRSYGPDVATDATQSWSGHALVRVPGDIPVIGGNGANGSVTLTFTQTSGTITCSYAAGAASAHPGNADEDLGLSYQFTTCSNDATPDDIIDAIGVTLHIAGGDDRAPTTARVVLSADEVDIGGFAVPALTPGGTTPPARQGWVGTFSRAAGGVYMLGGTGSSGDLHDAWFRPIDGPWRSLPLAAPDSSSLSLCGGSGNNGALGHILSAVYSYVDERLWLLDSIASGATLRLLRSSISGETFEVVKTWTSTATYDTRRLSLDRDGRVLLTFSKSNGWGFKTLRIEVPPHTGTPVVTGRYTDGNKLVSGPHAGVRNLAYVRYIPTAPLGGLGVTRIDDIPSFQGTCSDILDP
jgi:hypothetical protein